MNHETVVDCLVVLEGENPSFMSYMLHENAVAIQEAGGLSEVEQINLRETPERLIPDCVKKGESCIIDILVKLEPSTAFCLN